jgi:hypothetical protein
MHLKINFNNALVLSLFWHLFCFFIVTIVIVPVGISQKRLSEVYFLGSLLDKSPIGHEFKSPDGFLRKDRGILTLRMPKNTGVSRITPFKKEGGIIVKKRDYDFREASVMNIEKAIPGAHIYDGPVTEMPVLEIRHTARKILFRPPLSEFTAEFAGIQVKDNLSSRYNTEFSVSVKRNGTVESVYIMKTSGNTDIDIIMEDYIKKCEFEPFQAGDIQESVVSIEISF